MQTKVICSVEQVPNGFILEVSEGRDFDSCKLVYKDFEETLKQLAMSIRQRIPVQPNAPHS